MLYRVQSGNGNQLLKLAKKNVDGVIRVSRQPFEARYIEEQHTRDGPIVELSNTYARRLLTMPSLYTTWSSTSD